MSPFSRLEKILIVTIVIQVITIILNAVRLFQ